MTDNERKATKWIAQVRAWASSFPQRDHVVDDSRETIYSRDHIARAMKTVEANRHDGVAGGQGRSAEEVVSVALSLCLLALVSFGTGVAFWRWIGV